MPPYEINTSDMFFMNEKGEHVKITRFSEMENSEVQIDPRIDLKELYLHQAEYEATIELTPESAAQLAELQKQCDAETIENLRQQIKAVDAVISAMQYCLPSENCTKKCPYYGDSRCIDFLMKDTIAIAEAYKKVVESGLQMMENRNE